MRSEAEIREAIKVLELNMLEAHDDGSEAIADTLASNAFTLHWVLGDKKAPLCKLIRGTLATVNGPKAKRQ